MNKSELTALAMKLYDGGKGISYGKIADKFNADGIPTVTGKGKWEKKMVSRLVAGDTLKKAELKTGLKSDREVQLESEIESLKAEQNQMLDVISMLRKQNVEMKEMLSVESNMKDDVISVVSQLESENAGLRQDRDEVLKELNRVKQHLSDRTNQINAVYAVNAKLTLKSDRLMSGIKRLYSRKSQSVNGFRSEVERLSIQRDCFKAEAERLQRQLAESELKYKSLYEAEITRLGNELAVANQTIQELKDKQAFIKIEQKNQKNFEGWTLNYRSDGRGINLVKRVNGEHVAIYIGKTFDPDVAREKICMKIGKISKSTADTDSSNSSCLPLF